MKQQLSPVTAEATTDEEALVLVMNVLQRIADTALAGFKGDGYDESSALSDINNISRDTIDAMLKRTMTVAIEAFWKPIAAAPTNGEQILVGFQGQFKWFSYVANAMGDLTGQHTQFAAPTHWTPIVPPSDAEGKTA